MQSFILKENVFVEFNKFLKNHKSITSSKHKDFRFEQAGIDGTQNSGFQASY